MDDANVKRIDRLEERMSDMEVKFAVNDSTLKGIEDDTKWLRRTITQALIGGIITVIVGAFFFLTNMG